MILNAPIGPASIRDFLTMASCLRCAASVSARPQPLHPHLPQSPSIPSSHCYSHPLPRRVVTRAVAQSLTASPQLDDFALDVDSPDKEKLDTFDLVVAGAGPSGLSVGARVAKAGFNVCVVDPCPLSLWPNNYGVWVDEFEAMGLDDCFDRVWTTSEVYLENTDPPKYPIPLNI